MRGYLGKLIVFGLSLVLILFIVSPTFAWQNSGYRYYSPSIAYKHRSSSTTVPVTNAFNSAASDWNRAVSGISFYTSSSSANEVYAVNIVGGVRGESALFNSVGSGSANGNYFTMYSNFNAYVNTAFSAGTYAYRSTAGHEFGHVLGLGHTTGNVLMNGNRDHESIYTPQTDDKNGVRSMWGL